MANKDEVLAVLLDRWVFDRISPEGVTPELFLAVFGDGGGAEYIGGFIDGHIASLYIVHDSKMHFMVLPEHRAQAGELLGSAMGSLPGKVWCEIPVLYRSTINFALKRGFTHIKTNRKSYSKSGKLYDTWILEN